MLLTSKVCNSDYLDSSGDTDCTFSHEEHTKFTKWHENGYDLRTDQRYNKWLKIYHPTGFQCTNGNCLAKCIQIEDESQSYACITDMCMDSLLDLSFTNGDISRSLENFSPCLESTPNIQKSKSSEKGNLFGWKCVLILKINRPLSLLIGMFQLWISVIKVFWTSFNYKV